MKYPIFYKRILRRAIGGGEILCRFFKRAPRTRAACIFYYHRVAALRFLDRQFDDRNVTPGLFEKQLAALRARAELVSLGELLEKLDESEGAGSKPLVSLTFDDGYANFRTNVLPILERHRVPATLTVVTGLIASERPAPFDRWARKNIDRIEPEAWRLLGWDDLEHCAASPLVTIGAHSHRHRRGDECSDDELAEEAGLSAEVLRRRLGRRHARIFAYPFGNTRLGHVSAAYERAVRAAGYTIALTTDVGLVRPESDRFRLPRLEAHSLDSGATLLAKSAGALAPLYCKEWFHELAAWRAGRGAKKAGRLPARGEFFQI
jgi:peptidoglycan/xylan/chitin deacetylase (PgdA/CDA1 family)